MKFRNKTDGLLNFMDLKGKRFMALYWLMFAGLFALSLACLLPVAWVALSGFKETSEMYGVPPAWLPKRVDFGKVAEIWRLVDFGGYLLNTLAVIVGCWGADILLNGLAGYVLSRVKPWGSAFLETALFWTMLLPGISMVPLYMTFVDMPVIHANLTGSFVPIWLMAGCNAFNIFLFRSFFNSIPMEYLDAAKIDGCTNLGIFRRIIIPLSKPIIVVVTIFSVTGSWSNFMWPYLILGNTALEPVSVLLYKLTSASILQDNQKMLIMMISIIPPLLIYSFFSRHIMGGLNMSGIKG
jgi:multiple sugar transport system permease protein